MPRRNRPRDRWSTVQAIQQEPAPLTTHQMAQDLVERGLAGSHILDARPAPRKATR